MGLVDKESTIFDVISTIYTAVPFHELFKEAALNGNSKLEFDIQCKELLKIIALSLPEHEDGFYDAIVRSRFDEIFNNGDGSLDEAELLEAFRRLTQAFLRPLLLTWCILRTKMVTVPSKCRNA
jgi:hypothetical protein